MEQTPLVSVVLNTFNRATLLPQSVESVLSQDYPNFEIIIVDDCSTDNTAEIVATIVAEHSDQVRSIRLPKNRGLAAARNVGIRAARGPLVSFQDDDDVWLPGRLSAQVAMLNRHPECALCYGVALQGTLDAEPTDAIYGGSGRGRTGDNFRRMLRYHSILFPCATVRKQAMEDEGLFDETLETAEDTDLLLRLTMRHPAAYLRKPCLVVRQHPGRKTNVEGPSGAHARCSLELHRKLLEILPPEREQDRGIVAATFAMHKLALAECEIEGIVDCHALIDIVDTHPDWFAFPDAFWLFADRLVCREREYPGEVMRMSSLLSGDAGVTRRGRRHAAMFLNAAVRRGIRRGMPAQAFGWAVRYALLMPRVLLDSITTRPLH